MLKLKRKTGQSLIIGNKIKVKVIETQGEHVEIGIDAPKDIIILRSEVHERMKCAVDETV